MRTMSSIDIARSIDDVFAYVTNLSHLADWTTLLEVKQTSSGQARPGDTYSTVSKFLGIRTESHYQVTVVDRPSRLGMQTTAGPLPHTFAFTFEPAGAGTHVTLAIEGEPHTFFKIARPIIQAALQRELDFDIHALKDILESSAEQEAH